MAFGYMGIIHKLLTRKKKAVVLKVKKESLVGQGAYFETSVIYKDFEKWPKSRNSISKIGSRVRPIGFLLYAYLPNA